MARNGEVTIEFVATAICAKCKTPLEADGAGSTITVWPCDKCDYASYEEGHKDGDKEGYKRAQDEDMEASMTP